jgi:hypothetical protein
MGSRGLGAPEDLEEIEEQPVCEVEVLDEEDERTGP